MLKNLQHIIKQAGKIALKYFGKLRKKDIEYKNPIDLVTIADKVVENFLKEQLMKKFPNSDFLCEESCHDEPKKNKIFIIDPIDGTTNFVHSYPLFSISLAYQENDSIQIGLVYLPYFDHLYYAVKGQGAFCNKEKIHVSHHSQLIDSLLVTGFACVRGGIKPDNVPLFNQLIYKIQEIRRDGSAACDLCYVAHGKFDLFWEMNLNTWDVAAGALIVQEAGGKVTDFDNQSQFITKKRIIASNGIIHNDFINLIQRLTKNND